jgi:hypothetical protein
MIDLAFLTLLGANFGLPGAGCFVGTYLGQKMFCPNRRCCQTTKIRRTVEGAQEEL